MPRFLATKPLSILTKEAYEVGENTLRRSLGPVNLITLGIGAIIGAGLFSLTGVAAAQNAGPVSAFCNTATKSQRTRWCWNGQRCCAPSSRTAVLS